MKATPYPTALRVLISICICWTTLQAQELPVCNIYLFKLDFAEEGNLQFNNPRLLTGFNPDGYNNHPAFMTDELLYISSANPDQQQPEIIELNLSEQRLLTRTRTPEGEFSPAPAPDYRFFSCVRREKSTDGSDLLRLWELPRRPPGTGRPVFRYIGDIGYYEWLSSSRLAIFRVREPSELALVDVATEKPEPPIATDVGRCFRKLPNGNLAYVQKSASRPWQIIQYNYRNGNKDMIISTLQGSEDFAVLRNGTFLMGQGSDLYKFDPLKDDYWVLLGNLRGFGIENITRIAVSPNEKYVAIVSQRS